MYTVDEFRRAAEGMVRRDATAQCEAWLADSAAPLPPAGTNGVDPFTTDAVSTVRQALDETQDKGSRRVLTLLHRGLVAGALDRMVRPALRAASASAAAHLSFLLDEAPYSSGAASSLLRTEETPQEERARYQELLKAWRGSTNVYLEATRRLREGAAQLGLQTQDELLHTMARVEPEDLRQAATRLLDATDQIFEQALEQACHAHALEARPAHLPRLFGLPGLEHRFTVERMLPVAGTLLDRMGINVAGIKGLRVLPDPVARPRPSRAFPINLPREVRLIVNRSAGLPAAQVHLLALGQALHWLYSEPGPFPYRWPFGHRALDDAYGLLLAEVLSNPVLLRDRGLPSEVAEAVFRVVRRSELLHLRTMAALVEAGGPEGATEPYEAYAACIERARMIPLSEEEARAWPHRVELCYAAETLQSWILAASLVNQLELQVGEDWRLRTDTRELWTGWLAWGQRYSVTELLARLGSGSEPALPLDPFPLVVRLRGAVY